MKKSYKNAINAILHSQLYDEIAYCQDTPENYELLRAECSDWTDSNDEDEFWADAENSNGVDGKMDWRVHIRRGE